MYLLNAAFWTPIAAGHDSQGSVTALIVYVALAVGVSFICSILEASLLSTSQSHVEVLVERGKRAGLLMQKHKQDVDRPISAILTLNTIANTAGAAGAGAQAAAIFGDQFIGLISATLTLMILVFSEVIPKTLGAVYWKQLTTFTAFTVQFLVITLAPAVRVFEGLTRLMRPDKHENTVTRADLEVLAKISAKEGTLLEQENRVLRNLLRLDEVTVETIMTPRTVMMALQKDLTVGEVLKSHEAFNYSRIPIYDANIDDICAYVLRHQIFLYGAVDRPQVILQDLAHGIHVVPETASVADVLDDFIAKQEHIFLVIDEYGGTAGVITLEDAIEALLGIEITDESDVVEDLRKLATERYQRQLAERSMITQASSGVESGL